MKTTTKILLVLETLSLLGTPIVWANGGESAGGADNYRPIKAWFRSKNPNAQVKACYVLSPTFGVGNIQVEKMITKAFSTWGQYLRSKQQLLRREEIYIARHLKLRPQCLGDEDLKFYFGVEDPTVLHAKAQYREPFGFAEAVFERYQPDWIRGFVWIANTHGVNAWTPVWNEKTAGALSGLILHEIGHVFGNGHVEGTVMTRQIGQFLERDSADYAYSDGFVRRYSKIDSEIELIPCLECKATYPAAGRFDPLDYPDGMTDREYSFNLLVGKKATGPVSMSFERDASTRGEGRLILADRSGRYEISVRPEMVIAQYDDNTPLFSGEGGSDYHSFAIAFSANVKTLIGEEILVGVGYNMSGHRVQIVPLNRPAGSTAYPRPIFVSE